jgi:sugar phosphate isomerase/epimerase
MKFGVCAGVDKAKVLAEAGYDYIELPVGSVMPEAEEAVYNQRRKELLACPLVPEAFNSFLPGDLKIVGPAVDTQRVRRYLANALKRVSEVGGQVLVFGSGGARNVPEGFSRQRAWSQLVEFLHMAADQADASGVTLAAEPLNRSECNIINTVPEAVALAEDVNRPPVRVLADLYHISEDQEPLDNVLKAGTLLAHVHVADTGRFYPGSGSYDYSGFFGRLKQIGYNARTSAEGRWTDFDSEVAKALPFLRDAWSR